MRILRDTKSINTEIKENPDPAIATLLTRHLQFGAEFNPDDPADLLTVFVIEPGDTLQTIDHAMNGCFLVTDDDSVILPSCRASRRSRITPRCTRCCSSRATRGTPL